VLIKRHAFFCSFICALTFKFLRGKIIIEMYKFFKIIINSILRFFWGLKIEGQENIPKFGGFILLLDEGKFLECLALEAAIPGKIYWAVSHLEFRYPVLKWFFLKSGCFFLDTEVPDTKGFRSAFAVLNKEGIVAFYPLRLTKGIGLFCLRSARNILPALCLRQNARPRLKVFFAPVCNFKEYREAIVNIEIVEGVIQRIRDFIVELNE